MKAPRDEIDALVNEGIEVLPLTAPVRFTGDAGRLRMGLASDARALADPSALAIHAPCGCRHRRPRADHPGVIADGLLADLVVKDPDAAGSIFGQ